MIIYKPMLKPKSGYVEVDINGNRTYLNATTGKLINEECLPEMAKLNIQIQTAMIAFAETSTNISNNYAIEMPDLFPTWEDVLIKGEPIAKGRILNDNGQLYRVNQEQVIPQEHQPPHGEGMTAIYIPINKINTGTIDDPIPAIRGMEYVYGFYYLDSEDGKIYICKRTGESDGGTIVLQYLPHDLIGQYFETVT